MLCLNHEAIMRKLTFFESAVFIEPPDEILKWHKCNINLNIWRLICIMFATSGIVVQSITWRIYCTNYFAIILLFSGLNQYF